MVPILFELLQGTPFLAMFFRLLGTKIGKRVLMDEAELYEFDLVEIFAKRACQRITVKRGHGYKTLIIIHCL